MQVINRVEEQSGLRPLM